MGYFHKAAALFASLSVLAAAPSCAFAQETAANASAEVPDEIPTSAFAARSQLSGARLSPDGTKFALTTMRDDALFLSIFDAQTRAFVGGTRLGERDDFNWFRWAGNDRILLSMRIQNRRETYSFSRLLALELGQQTLIPLVLPRMAYDGDDVIHIDNDGRFVLVSMEPGLGRAPSVYRFDLAGNNGQPPEGIKVQSAQEDIFSWIADDTGVVRMGIGGSRGGRIWLRYRSSANDPFETVARTRIDEEGALEFWNFMGLRAGRDTGYAIGAPDGGDRRALFEFDFTTGQPGDVVFASEDEDVSGVVLNDAGTPIAVSYAGDIFRREWLDPQINRWRRMLGQALTGSDVTLLDIDDDRSRMLVLQSGPADPGALYVFSPENSALDLFAEYRPQVPAGLLSAPQPIRYDARDGTSIHGYLTLPKGREARGLPLIVHPHGGPYGIRDWDEYSDMVQFLANRGYAVMQPNFRGSGGYGESFELLGNGQIGRAMQDDLDDAVAHLVDQGIVDPQRVCILGSSYGGFAALWGAIRNPEIYRCAVSFAGVTHFERQLSFNSSFLFGRNRSRWWDRVDGDQTNFDLDDVSPAVQVARLTRPVLLVHGEEDSVVPYDQYELMVRRARNANIPLETLSLEEAGHGFDRPEDEQAYYDAIDAFLARHNPAD